MNTTLTIKLPKKLRDDAKRTAKKLGIPLTTATTALLRQFVVDQEIVLSAKRPKPDLLKSMRQLRDPMFLSRAKRYATAEDLLADVL